MPRPLREVRGRLDELLARAGTDLADCAGAWVRAVLTDPARPTAPIERLRAVWPHTLALDFQPDGGLLDTTDDLTRLAALTDPVEICAQFVAYVDNVAPDDAQRRCCGSPSRLHRRATMPRAAPDAAAPPEPAGVRAVRRRGRRIDFDELAGSGLFLLEGPTGAGKSTVLDALTFALYGELSAETTTKDRLHSDFADPSTTP